MTRIPFNRPFLAGAELEHIRAAVEVGQLSAGGRFTALCEALLAEQLGAPRVLLTTSCTHALELSALLLDLQPGDEVVVPAYTFVTTATAFANYGARLRFVDVREDTLCLDERRLPEVLGPRTRAIVPVHYGGIGCELEPIGALAAAHGALVIEDNAHGLFAARAGKPLGTFGALGAHSFHETKNLTCGEGGALVINDPALVARAEVVRDKGTDRSRFLRGEVDRYTWVDRGSSFGLSEVLAAFLWAQLGARERIYALRRAAWERYDAALRAPATAAGWRAPTVPPGCSQSHHLYYLVAPSAAARQALIRHLDAEGILAIFHYQPLHLSKMGRAMGGRPGECPVTESIADRLVRLPLYNAITDAEQTRVISAILNLLASL